MPKPDCLHSELIHQASKYEPGQPVYHTAKGMFGEVVSYGSNHQRYKVFFEDGSTQDEIHANELEPGYLRIVSPADLQVNDVVEYNNNIYIVVENDDFFQDMTIQQVKSPDINVTFNWDQWQQHGRLKEFYVEKYNAPQV